MTRPRVAIALVAAIVVAAVLAVQQSGLEAAPTAEMLRALASLFWPLGVVALVAVFRQQLSSAVARVLKVKLPGGVELELDQLRDQVSEVSHGPSEVLLQVEPPTTSHMTTSRNTDAGTEINTTVTPPLQDTPRLLPLQGSSAEEDALVTKLLGVAADNPRIGLIELSIELERAIRRVLAASGKVERLARPKGLAAMARSADVLPAAVVQTVQDFARVRNRLVHGHDTDVSNSELARAVDIGVDLLRAFQRLLRSAPRVVTSGIPLYRDSARSEQVLGVSGVVIEAPSGDRGVTRHVFPTTQSDLKPGDLVSWEWDETRVWSSLWYYDPSACHTRIAFESSFEFVGRPLTEV